MRVITIRSQIREVAQRWNEVYADGRHGENKIAIGKKLAALDAETATAEEVAEIIGNDSWARPQECNECGHEFDIVIEVGEDPGYGSDSVILCMRCLSTAFAALNEAAKNPDSKEPYVPPAP